MRFASDVNIGGSCFDIGVGKIDSDDDEGGFECHMILVRREDERKVGVVGRWGSNVRMVLLDNSSPSSSAAHPTPSNYVITQLYTDLPKRACSDIF